MFMIKSSLTLDTSIRKFELNIRLLPIVAQQLSAIATFLSAFAATTDPTVLTVSFYSWTLPPFETHDSATIFAFGLDPSRTLLSFSKTIEIFDTAAWSETGKHTSRKLDYFENCTYF